MNTLPEPGNEKNLSTLQIKLPIRSKFKYAIFCFKGLIEKKQLFPSDLTEKYSEQFQATKAELFCSIEDALQGNRKATQTAKQEKQTKANKKIAKTTKHKRQKTN